MDLAQSFGPSWARGEDSPDRHEQLAKKHGGGEEPRQRRGGRDDFGGRGPRKPRPSGDRDRGGKRDGGGGGRRDDKRGPRRDAAPVQKIEPALKGWTLRFLPDRRGVDGLAKQIKMSAKAFPLFDLARLVLEKSERYVVEFKRSGDDSQALWQVKADGTLWTSETEAAARALTANIEKYYRRERVTVDPPKGSFPFVAVCGMSGTLLGPPNYHDYQSKIVQLYTERFSNVPFEVFKNRIKMERDEALIEKWREEQSTRDVYYPIDPAEAEAQPEETAETVPSAESAETPTAPTPDAVTEENPPLENEVESPAAVAETVSPSPERAEPEPASAEPEVPAADAEATPEPESETETPAPTAEPSGERFESMADVEQHFRANHGSGLVVAIRDRVVAGGSAALNDSAPPVLELARDQWDELNRFPLPVAHGLGQQLASKGLHVFKLADKITYISVARPKWLDLASNPVSDALSGMLTYLSEHEKTPRPEQWAGLVELRPAEMADRESAVARDLSWLIHEGYVVDFARKGLWVVPRPKNRQPDAQPKSAPAAKPAPEQPPMTAAAPEPTPAPEPVAVQEPIPEDESGVEATTETANELDTEVRSTDETAPE